MTQTLSSISFSSVANNNEDSNPFYYNNNNSQQHSNDFAFQNHMNLSDESCSVPPAKSYDYVLKFLLVGDSDVGKEEILSNLQDDGFDNSCTYRSPDVAYKSTSILLYGKRVKLHIWDTSGQGRFSTVFRSYSRGAQGIILVYDITNKWSFDGLGRWLQEIDQHAPGVPKILIGNRKHFAFRRQISEKTAKNYANKHNMAFLEVSPLCNFNIQESCVELSRLVLERNGIKALWNNNRDLTLQELCYMKIVNQVNAYEIENLPLPISMKSYLKSFSSTVKSNHILQNQLDSLKKQKSSRRKLVSKNSTRLFNCDKFYRLFSHNSSFHNEPTASLPLHSKRNKNLCIIS